MVILRLDAVIAGAAVVRAWGSPDVARFAVLGGDFHGGVGGGGADDHGPVCEGGAEGEGVVVGVGGGEGMEVAGEDLCVVLLALGARGLGGERNLHRGWRRRRG